MKKTKIFILSMLLTLVILVTGSTTANATTWDTFLNGTKEYMYFSVYENPVIIPCGINVKGAWEERWDGSQTGSAELWKLYHSGLVYDEADVYFTIEAMFPWTEYDDGYTSGSYDIDYAYDWTLHDPDNMYIEGYNYPYDYYDYPERTVNGYVTVYAPETMQITKYIGWSF